MVRSNQLAAGSVANLTAQFNDIGVMMAAGQNPLQLALQQGTQITQVIGPMGAAGAVKALGSALVGMVNPVSLITLGSIAAGAAMVQWLTGADEDAKTLEDTVSDLSDGIDRYSAAAKAADISTSDLAGKFGAAAAEARGFLRDVEDIERRNAQRRSGAALLSVVEESGLNIPRPGVGDQKALAGTFDLSLWGRDRRQNRAMINAVLKDFEDLQKAADGPLEAQLTAVSSLIETWGAAARAAGGMTAAEDAQLGVLRDIQLKLLEIQQINKGGVTEANKMLTARQKEVELETLMARFGEQSAQVENFKLATQRGIFRQKVALLGIDQGLQRAMVAQWDALNPIRDIEAQRVALASKLGAQTRLASDAAKAAATDQLADLNHQARLARLIAAHGADNVLVEEARLEVARRVFVEETRSRDVSEELKAELIAAWDAANGIASVNMAGNITLAADEADRLAKNLAIAHGQKVDKAAGGNVDFFDPRNEAGVSGVVFRKRSVPKQNRPGYKPPLARKTAVQKQADALAKLIEKEELALAILRESDPVQKEMLRNREALAGATDAERLAVRNLIASRLEEQEVMRKTDDFASGMRESLQGIVTQPIRDFESLKDAVVSAIDEMQRRILRLVTDPIFDQLEAQIKRIITPGGAVGGGGFFGKLFSFIPRLFGIPANATGGVPYELKPGMIHGPGSGTSDHNLVYVSSGEMLITAAATARNRPVLEAMNAGATIPAFANGGVVGPSRLNSGSGFVQDTRPVIQIVNQSSTRVSGEVEETTDSSGRRAHRLVLADAVGDALNTKGGGAQKALKKGFGVKPRGIKR